MSTELHTETHGELVTRLAVERTELAREINAGNYLRAAGIAEYIRNQLMMYDQRVKVGRP